MPTEDYLNIDYNAVREDQMRADDRCIHCDTTRAEAQEASMGLACLKNPDKSFMHKFGPKRLEQGKHYVVGFAFDPTLQNVLLIHKNRPDWQAGKLNGVGGKVEEDDFTNARKEQVPLLVIQVAMAREFKEETDLDTDPEQWVPYAEIRDARGWRITFLFTEADIWKAKQMTDEAPVALKLELLHTKGVYKIIPNLNWLIPMALTLHNRLPITEFLDNAQFFTITETASATAAR